MPVGTILWEHGSHDHQFLKGVGETRCWAGRGVGGKAPVLRALLEATENGGQRTGPAAPALSTPATAPWNEAALGILFLVEAQVGGNMTTILPHPLPGAVQT